MKTNETVMANNPNKNSALAMLARDVYWQNLGEFHHTANAGFEFEHATQIYSVRSTGAGLQVCNIDGVVVVKGVE
ncbi:MAG: hypothetical protein Q8Q81_07120 [Oxalobacteraceae bacterium]|nr:hypothetical protein [Oxalobacteraceae bacterium]